MSKALTDPTGEAILVEWERRVEDASRWGELVTHLPGARVYAKRSPLHGASRIKALIASGVLVGAASRSATRLDV